MNQIRESASVQNYDSFDMALEESAHSPSSSSLPNDDFDTDDDSSDTSTIRRPASPSSSSSSTSTVRQIHSHTFIRAPYVPSGALDYHRYLSTLAPSRMIFLSDGSVSFPSHDDVIEILTTPALSLTEENKDVLLIFKVLPLVDEHGFFDGSGYVLGYDRSADAIFVRYFKYLPEHSSEMPDMWIQGVDVVEISRSELERLLESCISIPVSTDSGTNVPLDAIPETYDDDSSPEDPLNTMTDTLEPLLDTSSFLPGISLSSYCDADLHDYAYHIPCLSFDNNSSLLESLGISLILLICLAEFLLEHCSAFNMESSRAAKIEFVCDEFRNILEHASVGEWLGGMGGHGMGGSGSRSGSVGGRDLRVFGCWERDGDGEEQWDPDTYEYEEDYEHVFGEHEECGYGYEEYDHYCNDVDTLECAPDPDSNAFPYSVPPSTSAETSSSPPTPLPNPSSVQDTLA